MQENLFSSILLKKGKKALSILLLSLITVLLFTQLQSNLVYAEEYFTTQEYNVTYVVGEDNTFDVTEEIKVNFFEERHGIYRYIPLKGSFRYLIDGDKREAPIKARIKDVNVEGYKYNTETDSNNENLIIRIGDPDAYVFGDQVYKISYKVKLEDEGDVDTDFFYWNVLPHDWGTPIEKSHITIIMPKDFDINDCEFIAGIHGEALTDKVQWEAYDIENGAVRIEGTVENLALSEGVTSLIWLPEGYFVYPSLDGYSYALLAIFGLALLVAFLLWFFLGRDSRVVKTVEFYPPEDLSPAEVGLILDGKVDDKDMLSLFVYFAEKGWLTIEEIEEKALIGKKKSFKLEKKSEISNSAPSYQKIFFNALFKKGDSVRLSELAYSFSLDVEDAKRQLEGLYSSGEKSIYTKSSLKAKIISGLLLGVPILAVIPLGLIMDNEVGEGLLAAGLLGVFLIPASLFALLRLSRVKGKMKVLVIFITSIFLLSGYGGLMGALFALPHGGLLTLSLLGFSILTFIFTVFMNKRSRESARLIGKLLGFKEFIRVAEKDRINKLVESDPSYFYKILPYAYVFGLNDKWIKNFENIDIKQPDWYRTTADDVFDLMVMNSVISNCSKNYASQVLGTTPSSGGGSGGGGSSYSSGGGYSGGGGGGGGGGSW